MDTDWIETGKGAGLRFQIRWSRPVMSTETAESATWGELYLWVGETLVWGENEPVTWDWVDLLRFFTKSWPYLLWEEDYPAALRLPAEKCPLIQGYCVLL